MQFSAKTLKQLINDDYESMYRCFCCFSPAWYNIPMRYCRRNAFGCILVPISRSAVGITWDIRKKVYRCYIHFKCLCQWPTEPSSSSILIFTIVSLIGSPPPPPPIHRGLSDKVIAGVIFGVIGLIILLILILLILLLWLRCGRGKRKRSIR